MKKLISLCVLVVTGIFSSIGHSETLCAVVKIEIQQELTIERQAFEATMRITNTLDSFSIENLEVEVNFADANGNTVVATSDPNHPSAKFFIRLDDSEGVSGLSVNTNIGNESNVTAGTIAPLEAGTLRWLIIPTGEAVSGDAVESLYFVGAELRYTFGGSPDKITVAPDFIWVKAQPDLVLDYFMTREVKADEPTTQNIIEPVVPHTLGVRLHNMGQGTANKVKIESAQPKIVENEQGLAIGFEILSSFVDNNIAEKSLLIDFGDIAAHSSKMGRWIMETTLSGEYIEFKASFSHSDELGGQLTSLIDSVNAHFLEKDVMVDLPGRDKVLDYLAADGTPPLFTYTLYESDHIQDEKMGSCYNCAPVTFKEGVAIGSEYSIAGNAARDYTNTADIGFNYFKIVDPYRTNPYYPDSFVNTKYISSVIRSDGKLLNPNNYWLSETRDSQVGEEFHYYLNIFDFTENTATYTYTFTFEALGNVPQAPSIASILDKAVVEKQQVNFLVLTTDLNGTIPALTVSQLPEGARFTYDNNGKGAFYWTPAVGQAGIYTIEFTSSDGELSDNEIVQITVTSINDSDSDGMLDEWEIEHFGDLSRDGTQDADGDGFTDLEEFNNNTDPNDAPLAPSVPRVISPINNAYVESLTPTIVIENSRHSTSMIANYDFELYADEELTELIGSITAVAEGVDSTTFLIDSNTLDVAYGANLLDHHGFYWRVRAYDSELASPIYSEWLNSKFNTRVTNEAPVLGEISSPVDGSVVTSFEPLFSVTNASDSVFDSLTYSFYLYEAEDTDNPIDTLLDIEEGLDGVSAWNANIVLQENQAYSWKYSVSDGENVVESNLVSFYVNLSNEAPLNPVISFPLVNELITGDNYRDVLQLSVTNSSDPEGDVIAYEFEIDTSNAFDSSKYRNSGLIAEGALYTTWNPGFFYWSDNTQYFWRVRAVNEGFLSNVYSDWVYGSFQVNSANDLPSMPVVINPGNDAQVLLLSPVLKASNAIDLDGDQLTYEFELCADFSMQTDCVSEQGLSTAEWTAPTLTDMQDYFWHVRANDGLGNGAWSSVYRFHVNVTGEDEAPLFQFELPVADIALLVDPLLLQWQDSDANSSAAINLYYNQGNVVDHDLENSHLIIGGLQEDFDGPGDQYLWNHLGLPAGEYRIWASIDDGVNPLVYADLPAVITLEVLETVSVSVSTNDFAMGSALVESSGPFYADTYVTVLAIPEDGFAFQYWENILEPGVELSTSHAYTFVIEEDLELRAVFAPADFDIAVSISPLETGSVSGGGDYLSGDLVTLQADAYPGFVFVEWLGTQNSTDNPFTFSASANESIIAMFRELDITAPEILLSGVNEGAYYNADITPTIVVSDDIALASTVITLNGNPFTSGTSISAEGAYTLAVVASDASGNESNESISFVVDKTEPVITVSGVTDGQLSNTDIIPVINVVDDYLDSTAATLNGTGFSSGTAVSLDGAYSLLITAIDLAGNENTQTIDFAIDQTAPVAPVVLSPSEGAEILGTQSVTINGVAEANSNLVITEGANVWPVTVDGAGAFSFTNTFADGAHSLSLSTSDAAGNISLATQLNFTVQLDITAPEILISGVNEGAYYNTDITPTVVVSDDIALASTVITLNGNPFTSGTSISAEGAYTLAVVASDASGNESNESISFVVDKTEPVITVSGVTDGELSNHSITLNIIVSDTYLVDEVVTLNGMPYIDGTSINSDGNYILLVSAQDAAGNQSSELVLFEIDQLAPVAPVISTPINGANILGTQLVNISGSAEAGSTVVFNDGVTSWNLLASTTGEFSSVRSFVDGEHIISVTATDPAGNISEASYVTFNVQLDIDAPEITISDISDGDVVNVDVLPIINVVDDYGLSDVAITLNGTIWESGTVVSEEGGYLLEVSATDTTGNQSQLAINFVIDKTAPAINITSVSNGELYAYSVVPEVSILDASSYNVNATLNSQVYLIGTPIENHGLYELSVTATDIANNTSILTISFEIDKVAPAIPMLLSPSEGQIIDEELISFNGSSEPYSLINLFLVGPNGSQTLNATTNEFGSFNILNVPVESGFYVATVTAIDAAGNISGDLIRDFEVQLISMVITGSVSQSSGVLVWIPSASNGSNDHQNITRWIEFIGLSYDLSNTNYEIVRNESDFIEQMRSQQFDTFVLVGLTHAWGHPLVVSFDTQLEIRARVAAGIGFVWINTAGQLIDQWWDLVGAKSLGGIYNIDYIDVNSNNATDSYFMDDNYMYATRLLKLGGNGVGEIVDCVWFLCASKGHAMVLNEYGEGRSVVLGVNPARASNESESITFFNQLTEYVKPAVSSNLRVSSAYSITWNTSEFADLDLQVEQTISADLNYLNVINGTQTSQTTAEWSWINDGSLEVDFVSTILAPETSGVYSIDVVIQEMGSSEILAESSMTIDNSTDSSNKEQALIDALHQYSPGIFEYINWNIAINQAEYTVSLPRSTVQQKQAVLDELLDTIYWITLLNDNNEVLMKKAGDLLKVYEADLISQ